MGRFHRTLLSTGCLFLLTQGWVCNGQVNGEGAAKEDTAAVLNTAVAEAIKAPATQPTTQASTRAAATEPSSTNLNSSVVTVAADGNIDQFTVQDMDINTALHLLSLQSKRNIITSKEVKGSVTANLYNVTFAEALDATLHPNGFGYVEKGNFIYVYTQKELEDIKKRERKSVNKIFRLKYMTAADAAILIKPALSSSGQVALTPAAVIGLPTGATDTGGQGYATDDTLVVNDYPENLSDIEKTLNQLDVRPKQVLIESTIMRATLKEDNALGIDFVSLSGIDFSSFTQGTITNNVYNAFRNNSGAAAQSTKSVTGTDFTSNVPPGGLSVGFLSNNINIFIRALEESTDTTVVANPKILALNKHRGEVFIGQQFGYKTTSTTTTTTQETVQFFDTGTKLIFRPYITDDGYVRMEVHPEDSSGGLNASNLPEKQSTEVTSNLMVKDGRTVVIGGLFREQTTASRGQVPVLGDLPILGVPFRRTNDNTQRTETIVLLTPHIINDDTALYEESKKREADVTRMMMGNRAGLQPWGRDRLAQTWYGKAQEALEKGNREKALMYTDWALNTNPRFIEAIKLREELTGKKVNEATESSISSFVRDVLRDDAKTTPDKGGAGLYPAPTTAPADK